MEKQPCSGRIVKILQDRYIQKRVEWGTSTKDSLSEPVLAHLRGKGIFKGAIPAFREHTNIINMVVDVVADEEGIVVPAPAKFAAGVLILGYGTAEFFLTILGIRLGRPTDEIGNWNLFRKIDSTLPPSI